MEVLLEKPLEQKLTTQEMILITAATVTGELSEVSQVAEGMTLSVMNAKTISHRAGESARGFQPITDYIEEIAKNIAQLVLQISEEATTLSRLAVTYCQGQSRLKRYKTVMRRVEEQKYVSSLISVIGKLSDESEGCRTLLLKKLGELSLLLDTMKNITRSSKVISTMSRVEAACTYEFRKDLEVVADDLESSTEDIRSHANSSHSKVVTVMELLNGERQG